MEANGLVTSDAWREKPLLLRRAVPARYLNNFDRDWIQSIVSRLKYARFFLSDDRKAQSNQISRIVPCQQAPQLLRRMLTSALRYTLLLNKVESVDFDVRVVRDLFKVPHSWRADDIVVTWSTTGSGIGYHAGHEDAIIVQAAGGRHWRIWSANDVDRASRRRILLSAVGDNSALVPSGASPVLDCELEPGDALYIPPFFPHEGVTLDDSISIALGWRGVAYFHIADAFRSDVTYPKQLDPSMLPDDFFDLIPDIGTISAGTGEREIAEMVVKRLFELGCCVSNPVSLSNKIVVALSAPVA